MLKLPLISKYSHVLIHILIRSDKKNRTKQFRIQALDRVTFFVYKPQKPKATYKKCFYSCYGIALFTDPLPSIGTKRWDSTTSAVWRRNKMVSKCSYVVPSICSFLKLNIKNQQAHVNLILQRCVALDLKKNGMEI